MNLKSIATAALRDCRYIGTCQPIATLNLAHTIALRRTFALRKLVICVVWRAKSYVHNLGLSLLPLIHNTFEIRRSTLETA